MAKLFRYKRTYFILLLPIAFLLLFIAKRDPLFTEQYFARGYYPALAQTISFLTSLIPFSIAEGILVLGVPVAIGYVCYRIYQACHSPEAGQDILIKLLSNLLAVTSIFFFLFTVLCGVNYHRLPFSDYSGLTIVPSTTQELTLLCDALMQKANALRQELTEDEQGLMVLTDKSIYDTAKAAQEAYVNIAKEFPVLAGNYPPPKPVLLSKGMSYLQITGVFTPYTCEANVNVAVPAYTIPATMCHELTHLRGFMREDEANYLAYLACVKSDYIEFQYSGVMLALVHSMNSLYEYDYDAFAKLHPSYDEGVLRDFEYNNAYWAAHDGVVAEVSDKVNDVYLKANSQEDGVRSYGRMVDLLLAEFRQNGYRLP